MREKNEIYVKVYVRCTLENGRNRFYGTLCVDMPIFFEQISN